MKKHWAIVLPLMVVGCTGPEDTNGDGIVDGALKPDSVSVVAPATPQGTVSGQVFNSRQEPISGASVSLSVGIGGAATVITGQTDGSGVFILTKVPAGSQVLVTVSKDGFATLRTSTTVPSSAGNIPINNGNANVGAVFLAETASTVRFTLVTPAGRPASGAQAYIEALPASIATTATSDSILGASGLTARGSVAGGLQADAQGILNFPKMPSPSELTRIGSLINESASNIGYRLWVDPVDTNGDGIIDSGGYSQLIKAEDFIYSSSRLVTLKDPGNTGGASASFSLLSSNVPSLTFGPGKTAAKDPLRNLLRSGEPIFMAFSQPVQKNSLVVQIVDEGGTVMGTATATANATSDAFTVALPSTPSIQEGQKYNVLARATSAVDGTTTTWRGYFISGDPKSPKNTESNLVTVSFKDKDGSPANGLLETGDCVYVTFNQVVTPSDSGVPVEAFINAELGTAAVADKGEYNATAASPSPPCPPTRQQWAAPSRRSGRRPTPST